MVRARPVAPQGGEMGGRRVAFVLRKAVVRKIERQRAHETIARDFGDDRRGGDRQTDGIAVDDRVGMAVELRQPVAVHQRDAGRCGQCPYRFLHRP